MMAAAHALNRSKAQIHLKSASRSRSLKAGAPRIEQNYDAVQWSKKCCWHYDWTYSRPCVQAALNASVTIENRPPPFLIVHGLNDRTVLPNQARWLYDALKKKGGRVDQIWHTSGHGGVDLHHAKPFLDMYCSSTSSRNSTMLQKPSCPEAYNLAANPRREGRATFQGHAIPMFHFYDAPHEAPEPPLLVWVHGGAWLGGSPGEMQSDDLWQKRMVRFGWAVVSLGYRHSTEAKWPAQFFDVSAALTYLHNEVGQFRFDRTRVVAAGFSSGGHLVNILGTRPFLGKNLVHGVITYSGPTQLLTMDYDLHLNVKSEIAHFAMKGPESRLVGCTLSDHISKFAYSPAVNP
jgi:acetyl esterase/lipase